MQISISSIKDRQGATLPFDFELTEADFDAGKLGEVKLITPVSVAGSVTNTGESMLVRARARGRLALRCSRCLQPAEIDIDANIDERYRPAGDVEVSEDGNGLADDDDVGYYERDRIEMGEIVRENFALQIPMKSVCNEECRGLCPQCGVNFNEETCSCSQDELDPRLAVLREWQDRHGTPD